MDFERSNLELIKPQRRFKYAGGRRHQKGHTHHDSEWSQVGEGVACDLKCKHWAQGESTVHQETMLQMEDGGHTRAEKLQWVILILS